MSSPGQAAHSLLRRSDGYEDEQARSAVSHVTQQHSGSGDASRFVLAASSMPVHLNADCVPTDWCGMLQPSSSSPEVTGGWGYPNPVAIASTMDHTAPTSARSSSNGSLPRSSSHSRSPPYSSYGNDDITRPRQRTSIVPANVPPLNLPHSDKAPLKRKKRASGVSTALYFRLTKG